MIGGPDELCCVCGERATGCINMVPVCEGCRTLSGAYLAHIKRRHGDAAKKATRRRFFRARPKPPTDQEAA